MTSTTPLATTNKTTLPLFVAAEALSLFGNAAISIVLPWLVLSRTGDPSVAGLVAAVAAVPSILATLVGGWLIDHVGQRRMSVIADMGSALSVAGLAIVDRAFGLDIGWFVVLGVLGALFDVPGMTARETLMGRVSLTSGVTLDRVAAIRQGVFGVAFLAGPAVAGVLLTVLDPIRVVWITAACSALAALCTLLLPLVAAEAEPTDGQPQPGGLATLWASPALRAMVVIAFGSALLTAPLITVLLPGALPAAGSGGLAGLHHVGVRGRVDRRRRSSTASSPRGPAAWSTSSACCCRSSAWPGSPRCRASGWSPPGRSGRHRRRAAVADLPGLLHRAGAPSGSAAGCSAWSTPSAWWPPRSGCR